MQIHELNTFSGTPGASDYLATDNGADTSKIAIKTITDPLNARIDNIIAGPASSAEEVIDARLGADGTTYPNIGDAIRGQASALKKGLGYADDFITADAERIIEDGATSLYRGLFDNDVYNPNTGIVNAYKYRISSRKAISFPFKTVITIPSGFKAYFYTYNSGSWATSGWKTGSFTINADVQFHLQIARTTEVTSETADINEFLSGFSVDTPLKDKLAGFETVSSSADFTLHEFEDGGWTYNASTFKMEKSTNSDRVRYVPIICPDEVIITPFIDDVRVLFFFSDKNGVFYSDYRFDTGAMQPQFSRSVVWESRLEDHRNYLAYIVVIATDITAGNATEYVEIKCINNNGFAYDKAGKNINIYKFGGQGNDWCFVRTPEGYDPHRYKPYPFVICNHGNGWVMDGTEAKANWTKRTMYVPTTDPDYIADPTEYNGTSDESLWYSNPTIEELLTAGYIVCGAENYGDNLYGNNNCRNACVDFFYHMVKNYNVEDRCYMIGASNGAMTSLNAAYILQGKVKAMILQYPLTCLVNQYQSNVNQQSAIRSAYGIADSSITLDALAKAVATHDPLTVDVIDGIKVGTFPPTKLYYSPQDVVVNYQVNALALAEMLDNSNKVVATVQCSGEHGDHTHFDPSAYVAWFNAN